MKTNLLFLSITLMTATVASPAFAGDYDAGPADIDDFKRGVVKKTGSFLVDHCYNVEDSNIKNGNYKPAQHNINLCDYKKSGKILENAFKQPTNFNKNYVLHQQSYKDLRGKTLYYWFAVNKTNKKVAVLPLVGKINNPNKADNVVFSKNSNKFCVNANGKFGLWDYGSVHSAYPAFDYMPLDGLNANACFYLKEDRTGVYWSQWGN
ncbi:hypothetical protein ACFBZI_11335 [Moraxella sp. ZJ142]|uniref:hypothetical protein n=1 Tax=Moraxella marmotae TaxID=3344520 RepID=UPI0035D4F883